MARNEVFALQNLSISPTLLRGSLKLYLQVDGFTSMVHHVLNPDEDELLSTSIVVCPCHPSVCSSHHNQPGLMGKSQSLLGAH